MPPRGGGPVAPSGGGKAGEALASLDEASRTKNQDAHHGDADEAHWGRGRVLRGA